MSTPHPNEYPVNVNWSEEDQEYLATTPAWPGLTGMHPTDPAAAQTQLRSIINEAITIHQEKSYPIPQHSQPSRPT